MKGVKLKILITFGLLFFLVGLLYYNFFVRVDSKWIFWKDTGESINWNKIEYDDDFFPIDTVESYGELGEWKFKEFRPIYAGYGTTEDGLNYLIGKYLDEDGKEQEVKILVSGEDIAEWPFPDGDFKDFYNDYYRENVAIWSDSATKGVVAKDLVYDNESNFIPIKENTLYACPEEVFLSYEDVIEWDDSLGVEFKEYTFVEADNIVNYCNFFEMFYKTDHYQEVLYDFFEAVDKIEFGTQISVRYLDSSEDFDVCRYETINVFKVLCANQYLNEEYEDFLVGIYIKL